MRENHSPINPGLLDEPRLVCQSEGEQGGLTERRPLFRIMANSGRRKRGLIKMRHRVASANGRGKKYEFKRIGTNS